MLQKSLYYVLMIKMNTIIIINILIRQAYIHYVDEIPNMFSENLSEVIFGSVIINISLIFSWRIV